MGMQLQFRRAEDGVLTDLASGEDLAIDFLLDEEAFSGEAIMDIDKSWHAIHFLLTGTEWAPSLPAGFLLAGESVGADTGYGPARILKSQDVLAVSDYLATLPENFIEANFDFDALLKAEIYPSIWDRKEPEDVKYVKGFFEDLKKFIAVAAKNKQGCVLAIV